MARIDQLNKILRSLQSGTPEVEAAALISDDGLMIASALPADVEEIRVGAMSATLLSLGTRAATELTRGQLEEVIVRGKDGYAILLQAAAGTLLLVTTTANAKLGLIFLDTRRAVSELRKVLNA